MAILNSNLICPSACCIVVNGRRYIALRIFSINLKKIEQMIEFIRNLFKGRKQQCNIPEVSGSYYQMIQEREKERSVMMQKLENEKIERGIKNEAQRWLNEDLNNHPIIFGDKIIEIPRIKIMRPFISAIIIHDEETAKYKGCNIQKLVSEEYQRLRSLNCH